MNISISSALLKLLSVLWVVSASISRNRETLHTVGTVSLLTRFREEVCESDVGESWEWMMFHFRRTFSTWSSLRMRRRDASTCDWRPSVKVSRHAPVSRNQVPTFCSDWKNPETQAPVSSLPRVQTWSEFGDAYSVPEGMCRTSPSVSPLSWKIFVLRYLFKHTNWESILDTKVACTLS